ncbi:MAG: Calx-beta domain-containing protein, partial [Gimesia chilikensis]
WFTVYTVYGAIIDTGANRPDVVAGTSSLNEYISVGESGNPLEAHAVNLSGSGTTGGFYVNNSIYKRIIDNGDAGFSQTGSWIYNSGNPAFYQGDYAYVAGVGGTGANSSTWAFSSLPAGTYRISGSWVPEPNGGATNMPLTISGVEGGDVSLSVNQQVLQHDVYDDGFYWQDLGYYTVDSNGQITITISDDQANGYVLAEAYRVERVHSLLSVGDVTVDEDAGTATFTVTSSGATGNAFTVDYATADGTAVAGSDYTATSGTLNFTGTAGETQTVTVALNDDLVSEASENFYLNLFNLQASGVVNIQYANSLAVGSINASDRITFNGTAGADDYMLQMNADGVTLELWENSTLVYTGLLSDYSEVIINGGAGLDTLTIDLSNGLPFPVSVINFDGEADGGAIILEPGSYAGTISNVTHSLISDTVGTISVDGEIINYTNTASLTDSLSATNRVFDFLGASETITVSDDGVAADGLSLIDSTLGAAVAYVSSGAVLLNANAGSGADTFNVTGLDSLNTGDLTITGGSDDDVTFQTGVTDMNSGDLNVTAQTITVASGISSTSGNVSLTAIRNIVLSDGSSLTTVDGDMTLLANAGGATVGEFIGIEADNATILSTGNGNISLTGHGGAGTGE